MITVFLPETDAQLPHVDERRKLALKRLREVAVYCDGPNYIEALGTLPREKLEHLCAYLLGSLGSDEARIEALSAFSREHLK